MQARLQSIESDVGVGWTALRGEMAVGVVALEALQTVGQVSSTEEAHPTHLPDPHDLSTGTLPQWGTNRKHWQLPKQTAAEQNQ